MLNNKGQSLILFVIILPILLLIVILVIDVGKALVLKQELKNINNIVIDYGLDNLDKEDLENELIELIKLNNDQIDNINVNLENDKIYVELKEKIDGIFSKIIDVSAFNINSSYVGYVENNEKRIERISGD